MKYQLLEFFSFLHGVTEALRLNVGLNDTFGKNLLFKVLYKNGPKCTKYEVFYFSFYEKMTLRTFMTFFCDGTVPQILQESK